MDQTEDWQVTDPLHTMKTPNRAVPTASEFLQYVSESRLLSDAEIGAFLADHPDLRDGDALPLAEALMNYGWLNEYHLTRLMNGQTFGLMLGNYRIVDRLGAGGMGVVYKAEHIHMKRVVALKVLATEEDRHSVFLQRFYSEMQALAVLRHPNIVLAFDAGEVDVPHSTSKVLRYLVMEYVTGKDLEQYVLDHGPVPLVQACHFVRQAAEGLRHAHEHGLVHRDIKPSNLLLTPQDQVKILDFGLARLCRRRCTEAHAMIGTVDYMAPEQARDARSVDIRADIYGLGGTLYWLLSGQKPFPCDRPPVEELLARQRETPLPLRHHCPDIPLELEAVVCQMMAQDPNDRYPTPLAVITALNAFLDTAACRASWKTTSTVHEDHKQPTLRESVPASYQSQPEDQGPRSYHILVVSDATECQAACRTALEAQNLKLYEARTEAELLACLGQTPCDLLVIDAQLKGAGVKDLCRQLRAEPPVPHLKLILLSANQGEAADLALDIGADDQLQHAHIPHELQIRIRLLLRVKEAEERADRLSSHLLATNQQLEYALQQRDSDLFQSQDVLIFAMAKMAELRGLETSAHLLRMQSYVRVLAEEAMRQPAFKNTIDATYVRMLERCVLLHDIGKVAIPDHVLLKPGRLDPEERSIMESHTITGGNILEAVARQHGACLAFLQMAMDIARHHHERFDGRGYPDGLSGEAIPLAARIVTIADVYDALRCKLVYKPGLSHQASRRLILESDQGHFDPALLAAMRRCENSFEQIFEQTKD